MVEDYIDLYAGAGGWSEGAKALGLRGVGIEIDKAAVATARAAGHERIERSVTDAFARNGSAAINAPGLIASPPCPTFSIGGKGSGRRDLPKILEALRLWTTACPTGTWEDERTGLVLEPLGYILKRAASERHFKWIAFEQVPTCKPIWDGYAEVLESLGYFVLVQQVDAVDFGVPQNRKRCVLMASREHVVAQLRPEPFPIGFAEALGLKDDWTLVSSASQGSTKMLGVRRSPEPSFTLTGRCTSMRLVEGHLAGLAPRASGFGRRVSVAEAGVLQGFPIDYPWSGSRNDQRQQIGNAVPPPLAETILRNLVMPWNVSIT